MLILIDNYDSFTFNLFHFLGDLGVPVKVFRNDAISVEGVLEQKPAGIVISPGPCDPPKAGICLDLIRAAAAVKMPLFGVCLGHQAIGHVFGGDVIRAPQPMHGKISQITHDNTGVLMGLPSPFKATRYHSLIVRRETMPDVLIPTAHTQDGLVMALRHESLPIHGVQFHPESIASEHGHDILRNFVDMCAMAETA